MKRANYIIVLQMLVGFLATSAFANDLRPLLPGILMVSISDSSASPELDSNFLNAVCEGIGKKMTQGSGVFGLGIFTEVNCATGENPVGSDIFWMKVTEKDERIFFTIGLVTVGVPFLKMAEVSVGKDKYLAKLVESDTFSALVAFTLLDQMPFQAAYSGKKRQSIQHVVTDDEIALLKKGVKIPESLVAFTAEVDKNGVIYPDIVGVLKTGKVKTSKKYLHATEKFDDINWKFKSSKKEVPKVYFGLRKGGRSLGKKTLNKILDEEVRIFYEESKQNIVTKSSSAILRNLGNSGYLGLRYGPALFEGDLIDQSKYFGVLVEFRNGLLGGLRLYHDYWPEVSGTINGQDGTFGGNRTIVAYSFSMSFDWFIRKIDLTPKVGIWNFRSKTPIEIEPGLYVSPEFEVKSAPSFDIELGLESGSSFHILRGWASNGASFLSKGGAEITSTRVGMDLLLSPWGGKSPVTVSLLSFFFYEAVQLKKNQQAVGEDAEADQLNYSQGYAGGGLAISW